MPGPAKKADKKLTPRKKPSSFSGDVTINDFANSPGVHNRLRKAAAKNDTELQSEVVEQMKKYSRSRRKNKAIETPEDDTSGIDYPLDLWFLISEYIAPEAVGKFARICKGSNHVVKTAKFWFHLYKRFYKNTGNLPERLTPACMVRPYGLRACVIRTLHFTYFSSADRIGQNPYSGQEEPHSLIKRRCCLMWHKKGETRWYFYFKLKEMNTSRAVKKRITWDDDQRSDLTEMLEDVSINSEEGCRILRVACLKYSMVPLVIGLILQTVKLDLSPGFDHHRLQLSFGTSFIPKTPTQVVVLSGVVDCKVLDWWHPCYPHQDTDSTLLQPVAESWDTPNFFDSPLQMYEPLSLQSD
ncbi:transmembrane protein 183 isoform X2 [Diachasma alloeum]|uniref:transmembrane protein 183 isoform X2 n=1 Tax=Diachasma alloeum TaxID=454923 RepID=UPI00073823FC|nr:transmembrane protein 183 isoform X2 [Diachasma alloeum]